MLYTYYHGCYGNIFFSNFFLWNMNIFQIEPIFFYYYFYHDNMCKTFCEHSWYFFLILTLKITINKMGNWFEKISFLVAMVTYFFPIFFCEIWTFFKSNPFFFIIIFKARIFQNIRNTRKFFLFTQIIGKKYVAMATMIICVKHFVNIPDIFF
jgi:hypothetical protein